MAGDQLNSLKMTSFSRLDKRSMSATMVKNLFYITGKEGSKASSHLTLISLYDRYSLTFLIN